MLKKYYYHFPGPSGAISVLKSVLLATQDSINFPDVFTSQLIETHTSYDTVVDVSFKYAERVIHRVAGSEDDLKEPFYYVHIFLSLV